MHRFLFAVEKVASATFSTIRSSGQGIPCPALFVVNIPKNLNGFLLKGKI